MDTKSNKKGCSYYINSMAIKKEKVCVLLGGVSDLVTTDAHEASVLSAFFSIKIYQVFVLQNRIWGEEQPGWKMFNSGSSCKSCSLDLCKIHVIRWAASKDAEKSASH